MGARDVVPAVVADEIGRVIAPADGPGDRVGTRDHVVVRQHNAAGIDHRAGPGSDGLLVVDLRGDLDDGRRDRRSGRLRIGGGGHRRRWCDQGQDRGERDQQRSRRTAQTRWAHLPILPEPRSARSLTAHSTLEDEVDHALAQLFVDGLAGEQKPAVQRRDQGLQK
jgi:hypothetical protein